MSKNITGMNPDKFKNIQNAFEMGTIGKINFDEPTNKMSFDMLLYKWKNLEQNCQTNDNANNEGNSDLPKKKMVKKIIRKKIVKKKINCE